MQQSPETEKIELFERTPIPRAVVKMAVPTVMSSLVMVIYNLVDTYFVGMLNDPIQNAAVTLAAPVLLAFNAVNNLFGVGSSSLMSRALGAKEYDTARRASSVGFYCALICAAMFSVFYGVFHGGLLNLIGADAETASTTWAYLRWTAVCGAIPAILNVVMAYLVRAEGAAVHASVGTMSGCVLNIILDPIFILPWGLNMGAAGAGLATFLSNCVALAYFLVLLHVRRHRSMICIHPRYFRPQRSVLGQICSVGVPAAIQNLLNVTGMTVLNNFTSAFGSNAVAAMGIAQKINIIPFYINMGVSQGIMPLLGYNYSSGNRKRMRETVLFAGRFTISILLTMSLIYYFNARSLVALFIQNEEVVAYGARFLRGMCLSLVFVCTDFLAVAVFQSCGMGKKSFVFALLRKIVLEIPALVILNRLFPLYGLAYAQVCAEVVLATVAVILLRRILWEKDTLRREVR